MKREDAYDEVRGRKWDLEDLKVERQFRRPIRNVRQFELSKAGKQVVYCPQNPQSWIAAEEMVEVRR